MSKFSQSIQVFVREHREVVLVAVIVVACIAFYVLQPSEEDKFLTANNWRVIAVNISTDALMVVGMTFVIIAGGFDLSIGSTLALGGIVACRLMVGDVPVPVAVVVGLVTGAFVGAVNGFIVTKIGVNPLITTLGTMSMVRGLARVITQATPVTGLPSSFTQLGGGVMVAGWEVPYLVIIMIVVVAGGDLLLRYSRFLRQLYYVGGNEEAARFSGINVDRVRTFTYIMTGLLAAAAGITSSARLISASADWGQGAELRIISAVVIGGASLSGGEGTVLGAFLGLLLVGIIDNGMDILGVNVYWKPFILGTILILAVTIDRIDREKIKRFVQWLKR